MKSAGYPVCSTTTSITVWTSVESSTVALVVAGFESSSSGDCSSVDSSVATTGFATA